MKVAIIADLHEDILNLQLALQKIEKLNCEEIVCLGDISGYSARHHDYLDLRNARGCLERIRKICKIVIAGNHDLHAAKRVPEYSDFHYPSGWYSLEFHQRLYQADDKVWVYDQEELLPLYTHEDIQYLKELPEFVIKEVNDLNIMYSHYVYPNLTGSGKDLYYDPAEFEEHLEFMDENDAHIGIVGHRHYKGLLVATADDMRRIKYGKKYDMSKGEIIMVPPITRAVGSNGFAVFDTENMTIEAIRI